MMLYPFIITKEENEPPLVEFQGCGCCGWSKDLPEFTAEELSEMLTMIEKQKAFVTEELERKQEEARFQSAVAREAEDIKRLREVPNEEP